MKEKPFFCDDCPILAQIPNASAEIIAVTSDPRSKKRKGNQPILRKVYILFAGVTQSENLDLPVGTKLRTPVKSFIRNREIFRDKVMNSVKRCKGSKKGVRGEICPAVNAIALLRKSSI